MKLSSYREHAREKPNLKTRTKEKTNENDRQKSTLV